MKMFNSIFIIEPSDSLVVMMGKALIQFLFGFCGGLAYLYVGITLWRLI